MVFEGHHRRERGDLRRPPKNLGALHGMAPEDLELLVGQLPGFVQHVRRRFHFADVVQERRQPKLP